jgi:uncharacterized protein (TIGR02246 family)
VEDTPTILHAFGRALEAGDADGAAGLFTADTVYVEPPAYQLSGSAALRDFIADFLARHHDVRFTLRRVLAAPDGSMLAAEWRWAYVRTADGTPRAFEGMCFVDLRDGLIARWRGFSAPVA